MKPFEVGVYARPCDGEAVAGDAALAVAVAGGVLACLVDGLGHGRNAAAVALAAIRHLKAHPAADVTAVLGGLHECLRGTPGAAAAVAFAAAADGAVAWAGVGNVVARQLGPQDRTFQSVDGVVGVRFRTPRVERARLGPGDVFLLYSDGVDQNFPPPAVAGTMAALARRVVLAHGKTYDDAACLAVRYAP
jgi:phosphoserine phosphatase RsbX